MDGLRCPKAACGHMFKHYQRAKEINPDTGQLEYVKFGNQQINPQLSYLNYNLAEHQKMQQGEFIRKRCSEVKLQNRKDVNVMCSWVLTAPKDLSEMEQKDFFKASYEFMAKRYGEENVISAYVHLDEASPHIHFAFLPVCEDKKKGGFKVSAKEVITKKDLQTFHQDLSEHLENALGHSVGILNGATKDGNKSISELKEKTARERAEKADREAVKKEKRLENLKQQVSEYANYLPPQPSEKLINKCEKILKKFDEENKLPFISKSAAREAIQAVVKQANIAIGELGKAEKTIYSLRNINFDAQKMNEKLRNEKEELLGENAELRQEISIAQRRERAAQRLGLSDVISAEVQREAEEKRSRQKERNKYYHISR